MTPLTSHASTTNWVSADLSAANAVWVAAAMLHRENAIGLNQGFSTESIVRKVYDEHLTKAQERTIYQHVNQHCVANREPMPNKPRMLFALGGGVRRLFVPGDKFASARKDSPTKPEKNELPQPFHYLLDWYEEWVDQHRATSVEEDAILALRGLGKHIWSDEHADDYINHLRGSWE